MPKVITRLVVVVDIVFSRYPHLLALLFAASQDGVSRYNHQYPVNMPIWVPYGLPIWGVQPGSVWVPYGLAHMRVAQMGPI